MTVDASCFPRAALHSVGCKLNQYETELLRQALEEGGCRVVDFDQPAEVYVLNSCTVTARTDRECRRLVRGARRRNPQALVILTGCYAQIAGEQLSSQGLADLVVGNQDKAGLAELILSRLGLDEPAACGRGEEPALLREFRGHTRAFAKIQEGCAGGCAYCLIARARGPERSVPAATAEQQVRLLAQRHPEVVLVGTHLGRWGRDLPQEEDLTALVARLCALPELRRLRLSSLEPLEVTPDLAELVVAGGQCLPPHPARPGQGKVCRHLHLPLQSGCDAVLERMGRPYRAADYAALVTDLCGRCPELAVGADVMVGFPGETQAEFEQTRDLLEELPLAYLHVFTFSVRPGTAAAERPDQVPVPERRRRNHRLRELSEHKRADFAQAQVGRRLEVVVERGRRDQLWGVTDNYLEVRLPHGLAAPGDLIPARVLGAREGLLTARPL